jgi:tetrathionate reductase subunit B
MARLGMVIDLTRCMRCGACMIACKTEHQIGTGKHGGHEYYRIGMFTYETGKYPSVKTIFVPTLCMQCENSPCIDVCPMQGALYRRYDGIVKVNEERCNGCKLCIQACPYKALYFNEEKLVVDKCDFCANRVDQGLEPACVAACMGKALIFGDLDKPDSEVSKIIEKNDIRPGRPLLPSYFNKAFNPSIFYIENLKAGDYET